MQILQMVHTKGQFGMGSCCLDSDVNLVLFSERGPLHDLRHDTFFFFSHTFGLGGVSHEFCADLLAHTDSDFGEGPWLTAEQQSNTGNKRHCSE